MYYLFKYQINNDLFSTYLYNYNDLVVIIKLLIMVYYFTGGLTKKYMTVATKDNTKTINTQYVIISLLKYLTYFNIKHDIHYKLNYLILH